MNGNALVVGNSDGIGLALTRRLLALGWQVQGVSRSPSPIDAPNYRHAIADVSTATYPQTLASLVDDTPPALCVYCAGIGSFFDAANLEEPERTLETNLVGAARTLRVLLPAMLERGSGVFVGLSSLADMLPSAEAPAYAASKAGMSYYLEGMARALKARGVSVVNVRLGFVDTKMAKSPIKPFMMSPERAAEIILAKVLVPTPPARITLPRRMAGLLWFVAKAQRLAWFATR